MDGRQKAAALAQLLDAQDVRSTMGGWAGRMRRQAGRPEAPTRVPMPDRTAGEALWDLATFVAPVDLELPEHMASALENWRGGDMGGAARDAGLVGLGIASSLPVVGAAPKAVKRGIRAYHGSPHDFDKFDLSKIGTGEGVQAYGHGLYAADAEDVARGYRDALTYRNFINDEVDPRKVGEAVFDISAQNGALIDGKVPWGPNRSLATKEQIVQSFVDGRASAHELSPAFQKQIAERLKPPGHMYEVQINADPEHFLDWDKPLSEQPHVVEALRTQGFKDAPWPYSNQLWPEGDGKQIHLQYSGGDALQSLAKTRGGDRAAAQSLREAGIPGIRYLDQNSRGAGDGTRNYVIFDDSIIEILRKYGIAGIAMLPPATAAAVRQQLGLPADDQEAGGA